MENKTFIDLKKPVITGAGSTLDKLRIKVDYQKGGINYFSGDICKSGVYVYITPCSYENGIVGQTITGKTHQDGYKILLKELNRKSQKQIDLAAGKIMPYAQQISDLYSDAKHREIYELIKSIPL
jgi:hypothetical protein